MMSSNQQVNPGYVVANIFTGEFINNNIFNRNDGFAQLSKKVEDGFRSKIRNENSYESGRVLFNLGIACAGLFSEARSLEGIGNSSTKISSEMEKKILEGQRKSPTKNEVIGVHSSNINNNNSNFAVEELSINPDGTKNIKFIKDLQDGNILKIKKSTVFPDSWNESKIIDRIKNVGDLLF